MHTRRTLAAAAALGSILFAAPHAEDKQLARKDLPPAVEKTVAAQSKGATVPGFSSELRTGRRSTRPS